MSTCRGPYHKTWRAGDRILDAWDRDRRVLMSEAEWRALPEDRRRQIVLMYERLRGKKTSP